MESWLDSARLDSACEECKLLTSWLAMWSFYLGYNTAHLMSRTVRAASPFPENIWVLHSYIFWILHPWDVILVFFLINKHIKQAI